MPRPMFPAAGRGLDIAAARWTMPDVPIAAAPSALQRHAQPAARAAAAAAASLLPPGPLAPPSGPVIGDPGAARMPQRCWACGSACEAPQAAADPSGPAAAAPFKVRAGP